MLNAVGCPQLRKEISFEALCRQRNLSEGHFIDKQSEVCLSTLVNTAGQLFQSGWTSSVTTMWTQLETTYIKQSAPTAGIHVQVDVPVAAGSRRHYQIRILYSRCGCTRLV